MTLTAHELSTIRQLSRDLEINISERHGKDLQEAEWRQVEENYIRLSSTLKGYATALVNGYLDDFILTPKGAWQICGKKGILSGNGWNIEVC
jgi:hypothetical protein